MRQSRSRKCVTRTCETVGNIVGTDHERIEASEDGADGEEVVPMV